jgi:hypothetical protein
MHIAPTSGGCAQPFCVVYDCTRIVIKAYFFRSPYSQAARGNDGYQKNVATGRSGRF